MTSVVYNLVVDSGYQEEDERADEEMGAEIIEEGPFVQVVEKVHCLSGVPRLVSSVSRFVLQAILARNFLPFQHISASLLAPCGGQAGVKVDTCLGHFGSEGGGSFRSQTGKILPVN